MIIPDNAVRYILLQRTHYIKLQRNFIIKLIKKLLPSKYNYSTLIDLEILIRKSAIINDYTADMEAEYSDIKNYLPLKAKNILDIGCGIGGINVFLSKHYNSAETTFYCLDKTQIDNIYYGYKEKAAFYNSLDVAREFLSLNGIKKIYTLSANDNNTIEIKEKFDLILSLISWGFHYPVETYLDQAYARLPDGGHMIIDIRKNTTGLDKIKSVFSDTKVISETDKKTRILAIKT
jgi:SAM-dependent methyltransferase